MSGESYPLVSLRYRNFRLLWLGQLISVSGSMMQAAAVLWHVSLLVPEDKKGLALGMVGLVRVVPIVAFSLISGVTADALPRRTQVLVSQICRGILAGVLAWVTLRSQAALWQVYLLTALTAAARAFDVPARRALVPNLVPRKHLPNAINLNTIMFHAASLVGPGLSGLVIGMLGVGWVYVINAISFLAVITALLAMRDVRDGRGRAGNRVSVQAAVEGLRYVFSEPLLRSTMLLDFFATFFSSALALLPIFAQDVLHVGALGYGWLAAAPSVGALVTSAVLVGLIDRIKRRGRTLLWAVLGYGAATVVFGLSKQYWLTFLCLALTGATDTVSMVLRSIIRQLVAPDRLRGRMTSVYMIFFMSGPQLGELEAGVAASLIGAPLAVVTGGLGCILATLWIGAKEPVLRSYRKEEALLAASGAVAN